MGRSWRARGVAAYCGAVRRSCLLVGWRAVCGGAARATARRRRRQRQRRRRGARKLGGASQRAQRRGGLSAAARHAHGPTLGEHSGTRDVVTATRRRRRRRLRRRRRRRPRPRRLLWQATVAWRWRGAGGGAVRRAARGRSGDPRHVHAPSFGCAALQCWRLGGASSRPRRLFCTAMRVAHRSPHATPDAGCGSMSTADRAHGVTCAHARADG